MGRGVELSALTPEEMRSVDPLLDESAFEVLGVERAVAAFVSEGSTAPGEVAKQVAAWRGKLQIEN